MLALVDEVKLQLDAELEPDGYNVGFNAGEAAGQTVDHMHIHVISRYHGDMSDPRGGVRHVIPSKGNYLQPATEPYALLDGPDRLLRDDLLSCLRNPRLDRVDLLGQAIATRVFHDPTTSFHPKAYLFSSADGAAAAAFVGSNNLSASGIGGGIEWAVGADQSAPFLAAFERLWSDPRSQPAHPMSGLRTTVAAGGRPPTP